MIKPTLFHILSSENGYTVEGSFVSVVNQAAVLDSPVNVTFGAGGTSANGHVIVTAGGEIEVVTSGYYTFKQRFRVGREGAAGISDLFFWAEISTDGGNTWNTTGNSVDVALASSKDLNTFFDVAKGYFQSGVKLRNRFARSGTGDDSGGLRVGTPSSMLQSLGVLPAPSAQITIYKI